MPWLTKEAAEQGKRADALFTEVGSLKVELASQAEELKATKAELEQEKRDKDKLEKALLDRQGTFDREAMLSYSMVSSVLADLGASVSSIGESDQQIPEDEFFEWLKVEMENLPEIIRTRSGYAASFTAEAVVGLLEKGRCTDTPKLVDKELAIDGGAREGVSAAGKLGAKEVAMEYWRKHGESEAKRHALARLAEVCFSFFFSLLSCFVTLCFLTLLLLLSRREGQWKSDKGSSQCSRKLLQLPRGLTAPGALPLRMRRATN